MPSLPRPAAADSRHAIFLVLASVALFAVFDSTVKVLGQIAPMAMVLWVRYAFQVGLTLLTAGPRQRRQLFVTHRPGLQLARGLALLSMSALAFLSLQHMPVGEFTAIVMLTPLLITFLAATLLGETVSRLRWALLGVGLACALLVIRPQGGQASAAVIYPLLLVVAGAAFHVLSSQLSRTENSSTTQLFTGMVGLLVMTAFLPGQWQALDARTWALLGVAGALSSGGHFLLILAYARASAATLTPYLYFQIAFATLAGGLLFGHIPDALALTGIVGIAFCGALGTWITAHESRRAMEALRTALPPD
ncbi:DMT family transporter [Amphibiibacter pelophylacis]|uniref:DMT family transporter n=1 Tax=Amphibiibacter pelophylacis TaxID=1799477 RepID=A0ACC6P0U1_9BURK